MSVCLLCWVEEDIRFNRPRPIIRIYFPTTLHQREIAALKREPLIEAKWNDEEACFEAAASSHEDVEDWAMEHFKFVDTTPNYPFTVGLERDPNRLRTDVEREAGFRVPWGKWRGPLQDSADGYQWKVPRNARTAWRAEHDKQGFANEFRQDSVVERGEAEHDCVYTRLLQHVSNETMKKVYRLIMRDVHPDAGGSDDKAKTTNAAWDVICKERGIV